MAATRITTQDIKDAAVTTAKILDDNVTFAKLHVSASGALVDGGSGATAVNVDGSTIEIATNALRVKADGIGKDQLGILTTKGDLLAWSTEPVRLPVGTDGFALISDAASTPGVKWSAVLSGTQVFSEVPTGTVNGVNAAFVFASTPNAGTLRVYKNGIRQKAGSGNDYQLATATVTFETGNLPQTGDILLGDYIH